jgi:hypothetical protein
MMPNIANTIRHYLSLEVRCIDRGYFERITDSTKLARLGRE